jgi:hypothetical protein
MILISHRANLNGPDGKRDNNPKCVKEVLKMGLDCEIDVWYNRGKIWLGHGFAKHEVDESFLTQKGLWCNAKNYEAIVILKKLNTNFFYHKDDSFSVTSKGNIWCYPSYHVYLDGVNTLPEINNLPENELKKCFGICTDFVEKYKKF